MNFFVKSTIIAVSTNNNSNSKSGVGMEVMEVTKEEPMQKNVEEFSRLQDYMITCEKDSETYKRMKRRYIELKVILTSSGVNLTELDFIEE